MTKMTLLTPFAETKEVTHCQEASIRTYLGKKEADKSLLNIPI